MAAIDLRGRLPRPLPAISSRLIVAAVAVFLLLVGAVIYGFYFRLKKQQQRKEQQQTALVAADAAQSNRQSVEGEVPVSALSNSPTSSTTPSVTAPFKNAVETVAHPFPGQQGQIPPVSTQTPQTPQTPPATSYAPASPPDPQEELRKQALEHRYTRQQQAIEAPTGADSEHQSGKGSVDPAQSEWPQVASIVPPVASNAGRAPITSAGNPDLATRSDIGNGYRAQNAQDEKQQFQQGGEAPSEDYLKTTRTPPLSSWVVQRGTVIPAALPHRLVSDLPGDLIADVARDVYDSPTQKYVLIPAGSRLVGEYNSSVTYGQNRVQIVWTAIYFPDGSFIDLDRMPAHASDGAAGLKDQVDNHWPRVVAGVALSSVLAAGLQISQNRTNSSVLTYPSGGQEAAAAIGTQAAQLGEQITNRNLNIQPTLKIRPGELFAVSVKKDMIFPGPYEPLPAR